MTHMQSQQQGDKLPSKSRKELDSKQEYDWPEEMTDRWCVASISTRF